MEIKTYAPVIIPTLNRYEHFKRCLESLEKCTGADKTDVYVALDYPPSEKYVEGWRKIDAYLKEKEVQNEFKKLVVIRREKNYGLSGENSNIRRLKKDYICSNYESFISSEDDNEFSPCFLEYMNKSLERYKEDESIIKVCGYNFIEENLPSDYKGNFFFSKRGCAWGTGGWIKKDSLFLELYNFEKLKEILKNDDTYNLLKSNAPQCISYIRTMIKRKQFHGDSIWEIYCALHNGYFVIPRLSKVRNYGNDGTGWHSRNLRNDMNEHYIKKTIDTNKTFEFSDVEEVLEYEYQKDISYESVIRHAYKKLIEKIDVFLLRNFNFIPKSKYI